MPISNVSGDKGSAGRSTFRPPWVKEGLKTEPAPSWTKRNQTTAAPPPDNSKPSPKENGQAAPKEVKLQSREIKVPVMTERKKPIAEPLKPKEVKEVKETKPVAVEEKAKPTTAVPAAKTKPVPVKVERSPSLRRDSSYAMDGDDDRPERSGKFVRPVLKKVPKVDDSSKVPVIEPETKLFPVPQLKKVPKYDDILKPDKSEPEIKFSKDILKPTPPKPKTRPEDMSKNVPMPPPPPPALNGAPPPPPPPPSLAPPPDFEKKPITEKQKKMLEKLKSRPRRRPDWSDMMKEVEEGRKLRHVECNDRSKPILTSKSITNIKGQFIYETEKANVHNILLKQIQGGIKLKPTRTNDRSKPVLEGLRKFRRQMTIEEQIQKSESRAQLNEAPEEESADEMDDIDKLRDDLQSTKQMLALELRNKEAQERENKRLQAKIQNLEAELEREKSREGGDSTGGKQASSTTDEVLVKSLKKEASDAQKTSKELEKKYQEAAEQLDSVKNDVEDQKRLIATLEKKLAQAQGGGGGSTNASRRQSEAAQKEDSPEPEQEIESESDDNDDEEKKAERLARRLTREVKLLSNKLARLKDKETAAKKERKILRDAMKRNQKTLKEEHKKYKKLQREVDKMATMMKEDGTDEDDDEEDAEEEVEEEEEEESTEEEEESETEEESDEETESESESEPEDAPAEQRKSNYEPRIKRHEGRLAALKKGNFLLQTNVDRLQDEINKMREKSVSLQADLDSVLSELG